VKEIIGKIEDVSEVLESAFTNKKAFYEMKSHDSNGELKEIFSREKYLEFLIDVAIQDLEFILEKMEEKEKRKQNLKLVK
jgi:hypothetical protein